MNNNDLEEVQKQLSKQFKKIKNFSNFL